MSAETAAVQDRRANFRAESEQWLAPNVPDEWDWQVAAVACDNPGAEAYPGDAAVGSLHRRLIPTLGLVGELLDFDRLAGPSCGRYQ